MRAVRARDAAWRRARAAAALRARATRALAKRLLAVGAARAEGGGRSGAGDANDGTGGAGAVSATLALSLAPGAGAARSTMSGTIIPMLAAATTAQRLHAFLRIIRSHTRRGSPCGDGEQQPSDHQRLEHPSNDTAPRYIGHDASREEHKHGTEEAKQQRVDNAPACWTMPGSPATR